MTLEATGGSLSDIGAGVGGAFSITLKAGGKGLSDEAGPPGPGAFSWTSASSRFGDCKGPELGGWDAALPDAGCGIVLGGRRTAAAGGVEVEGLLLTAGAGRVVDAGGVATRGGCAPGLAG